MGKTSLLGERQSAAASSTCQHHWLIETPQGTTSKGHCKKCDAKREFLNSLSGDLWLHDSNYWRRDDPW